MSMPVFYREMQAFRQPWLWLILVLTAAPIWFMFIAQIIFAKPAGDQPAIDIVVGLLWIVFGVGFLGFFWYLALVTEVRGDGLSLRFRPFPGRRIPWSEIQAAAPIAYQPLRDFGGWGLRSGPGGRRAYTVSGNRGVELTLTTGRRLVIGSTQPEQLHAAIIQEQSNPRTA